MEEIHYLEFEASIFLSCILWFQFSISIQNNQCNGKTNPPLFNRCNLLPNNNNSFRHGEENEGIVTLMEEDEHNRTRELEIKYILEEYNRSYQSLAEKYDCLKFILVNAIYSGPSSSSDAEIFPCNINSPDIKSAAVDHSLKCTNDIFNIEFLIKLRDELILSKLCRQNSDKITKARDNETYGRVSAHPDIDNAEIKIIELQRVKDVESSVSIAMWESRWNELNSQATMLMEENLQHQEELTRRNNQKRETIKELQRQIQRLENEKRALQTSLRFTREKFKPNHSPISRLAERISNKLWRQGCS